MKIDTDSILFILITIVILVISALGSRKKKRLRQMEVPASSGSGRDPAEPEEVNYSSDRQKTTSPFERIEQILGVQVPEFESMKGESIETTVDEEELIPEEIRKRREVEETRVTLEKDPGPMPEEADDEEMRTWKKEKKSLQLFGNFDEVKKAVIYSEIMNRKYN
ncbi:MAG: hypothetical protein KAT15_18075 [Bacteroidales bacterium]|nr:hypothetical protein [Bacteroidales bacterium]